MLTRQTDDARRHESYDCQGNTLRSAGHSTGWLQTGSLFVCALMIWMGWGVAFAGSPSPMTNPAGTGNDEVELVLIPAGEFMMGYQGNYDTQPERRVNLPAFFIDKYEVTNTRYKRFIEATGHKVPWSQDPAVAAYAWDWQRRTYPNGKEDEPVVLVSWEDARAFCTWAGKKLPTEMQWEKAARGANGNVYPWGSTWENGKANTAEAKLKRTAAVGTFKMDVSPYGVYDLGGNVSEWVEEWFAPYPGNPIINYVEKEKYKVLRGGSWDYFYSIAAAHHRQYATPQSQMAAIGFRCAKAADEQERVPPPPAKAR